MEKPPIPVSVVGQDDDDDEDPLAPARGLLGLAVVAPVLK